MSKYLIITIALTAAAGCMQVPLRNNTANEARTVGDLYTQQVLNNLAMFASDPNSFPYFSYANQGSSTINDQSNVGLASDFQRLAAGTPFVFHALGASASAQRQEALGFTLTPVNDPRKLELMRCAYQKAIAQCNGTPASTNCPDCQSRFKTFYTGSPDGDIGGSGQGIVTSNCLGGGDCWLGVGCKKMVPKDCPCHLVGQYCDTYVWVMPGQTNELTKLTLAILDYAINPFPHEVQKSVSYYIDGRGLPTTSSTAVGAVTANIGVSEPDEGLLKLSSSDAVAFRDKLQQQLEEVKSQMTAAEKAEDTTLISSLYAQKQLIETQLNFLDQQIQAGGLKRSYVGGPAAGSVGSPSGPGGGIFFLNQQQSTLGGVASPP